MSPAALLSCLLALALCVMPARAAVPKRLTVFAAASLQESLDAAAKLWTGRSGQPVVVSYAGSSALARQIEQGAPADVFVSADREWMDHLQGRGLIDPATRTLLVRNRLVLVAPSSSSAVVSLRAGELRAALGTDGRLALAETAGVPAGRYARQALQSLGLWTEVQDRLAESDNVRAALAYVARGEAPLGIVYATDARVEPKVRVLARIPSQHHEPIVYPMARVASTEAAHADGFLRFLAGPQARAVFARAGFEAP
jgi:molybdate transport system substrate-binding protein